MTFQPVVPFGGLAGWMFMQRTRESQESAFVESPSVKRDTEYFREKISNVSSAEDLVADRRLLGVALGAFGLDDDIGNKAFIEKVLSEGTIDPDAFANKLTDKRYFDLAKAFGFDLGAPNTVLSGFADDMLDRFAGRAFEQAVGTQNEDMRLALSLDRDMSELAAKSLSKDGKWFALMGNAPLRRVMETALGLPAGFGAADLDRQLAEFQAKSERVFGTDDIADFADPELQDKLLRLFLARSEASQATAMSSARTAMQLLQNGVSFAAGA